MDGPIQNVFPNIQNGWPHTLMFFQTYYMDGPVQNYFPNVVRLNGWPHTECFTKCTKWMDPYRMIF